MGIISTIGSIVSTWVSPAQKSKYTISKEQNELSIKVAESGRLNSQQIDRKKINAVPMTSTTGEVTRTNVAEYMQKIALDYYRQPFPHYDEIQVEHEGGRVLWKNLTPQQKYDVIYAHSLPHSRPKLLNRDAYDSDAAWIAHLDQRFLGASHLSDGTPYVPAGLETDPRLNHGTDHGMRVGIFSAVFAFLYNKYDPNCSLTPKDLLAIQLAGAFHDSGRQGEGVDLDDQRSAANAATELNKWGFSKTYIRECSKAISDKDDQKLSAKHWIAKCVQCADSIEFGRFGYFDPTYLDLFKDFNGYKANPKKYWFENIAPKPLAKGRTLSEFNEELHAVSGEMIKLILAASGRKRRLEFSKPGNNTYLEILNLINPLDHPRIYSILTEMGVIGKSFPAQLSDIKFVSSLGGSTGCEKVQDRMGAFYAKKKGNPKHVASEYHTNKAYRVLGVRVPEVALYNAATGERTEEGDDLAMLSQFVPEPWIDLNQFFQKMGLSVHDLPTSKQKKLHADAIKAVQDVAKTGFVADCLLANWDVAGLNFDNMKYNPATQEICRIDNGSGLDFRAQGQQKEAKFFTPEIQEFETMRNPKINPNAAFLFETLTDDEIIQQIDDILPKRTEFLAAIPSHLKGIMGRRFDYLSVYRQKLEQNLSNL